MWLWECKHFPVLQLRVPSAATERHLPHLPMGQPETNWAASLWGNNLHDVIMLLLQCHPRGHTASLWSHKFHDVKMLMFIMSQWYITRFLYEHNIRLWRDSLHDILMLISQCCPNVTIILREVINYMIPQSLCSILLWPQCYIMKWESSWCQNACITSYPDVIMLSVKSLSSLHSWHHIACITVLPRCHNTSLWSHNPHTLHKLHRWHSD